MPETDASEALFMQQVQQIAATCGWDAHHIRPARYGATWKTDGLAGMPDLILIGQRGQGIIWAELKSETGKPSKIQVARLEQLRNNGQEVYLWQPKDLRLIVRRLRKGVA